MSRSSVSNGILYKWIKMNRNEGKRHMKTIYERFLPENMPDFRHFLEGFDDMPASQVHHHGCEHQHPYHRRTTEPRHMAGHLPL